MGKKGTYRISNWRQYTKGLKQRGSLTIWFTEDSISKWLEISEPGRRGRPRIYSNEAILCALLIRSVYHLPLRALVGFLESLVQLLGLTLPVPCYTRICRRAGELGQTLRKLSRRLPSDIVFDSTGLKVYGEGEWKVRQHGKGKRRVWRKLHLAICPDTHEIMLSELTESTTSDDVVLRRMAGVLPNSVDSAYGDGAYDRFSCYQVLRKQGRGLIVPPRRGSRLHDLAKRPWLKPRNDAIRAIRGLGNDDPARALWKKLAGYHRRSLVETAMYRFKTLFGGSLKARKMGYQRAEAYAKCVALNRMTRLGMPQSKWQAA